MFLNILKFVTLMLLATCVYASNAVPENVNTTKTGTVAKKLSKTLDIAMKKITSKESDIYRLSINLWQMLSVILLVKITVMYIYKGISVPDIVNTSLLIIFVRMLIINFDYCTELCFQFVNGISLTMQTTIFSKDKTNLLHSLNIVLKSLNSIVIDSGTILSIGIVEIFKSFFLWCLKFILSSVSYASFLWSIWGYSITKVSGLLFIPMLLNVNSSWLFDGWFRFFSTSIIFGLFSNINLIFTSKLLESILNSTKDGILYVSLTEQVFAVSGAMLLAVIGFFSCFKFSVLMTQNSDVISKTFHGSIRDFSRCF